MEAGEFLQAFKKVHGYSPRVLLVGNIANNAYNNAKLLRKAGFDCDVLCHDYYHIMGCPEWEDADFEEPPKDDFRPKWHEVDLGGYRRPEWFAQGPMRLCLEYLIARREGRSDDQRRLWRLLGVANGTRPSHRGDIGTRWLLVRLWLRQRCAQLADADTVERKARELAYSVRGWLAACGSRLRRGGPLRERRPGTLWQVGKRVAGVVARSVESVVMIGGWIVQRTVGVGRGIKRWLHGRTRGRISLGSDDVSGPVEKRLAALCRDFAVRFGGEQGVLTPRDFELWLVHWREWYKLFRRYDFVIAYSTDPIRPMVAGVPYLAMEHGTLREIPYRGDTLGRLTALSYAHARHVFVTNHDCLASARRLCGENFTFVNHPYDEDHALEVNGVEPLRERLTERLDADFLVFFPTRHDWVEGTGYADKANDVLLKAAARLRADGWRVGVVCCEWGRNVAQSKALIRETGMTNHVTWNRPMGVIRFLRTARACDIVADQFKLGSFGGVTFKALAAGVPVCTYLDEAQVAQIYPAAPPVVNCRSVEEVQQALQALMKDRDLLQDLGRASRAWVKRHHAGEALVRAQIAQFAAEEERYRLGSKLAEAG